MPEEGAFDAGGFGSGYKRVVQGMQQEMTQEARGTHSGYKRKVQGMQKTVAGDSGEIGKTCRRREKRIQGMKVG